MAAYAEHFGDTPALLEEAEVGMLLEPFARTSSPVRRVRHNLTWFKQRHYIAGLLRAYAMCTVASEKERTLLASVAPDFHAVEVIQNCINLGDYAQVPRDPQPGSLIFTGSFRYVANHEAMSWFLQEVFPLIQARLPDTKLTITGDHCDLPLPPAPNVTLTGFVDDVWSLIAGSWISVAPLRSGGGTRVKILEAMALGTPVVATSKGAEGLDVRHGEHILIADTPERYASAVIQLLQDAALRKRLAENAYQVVQADYDWNAVRPRFLDVVERAAGATAPRAVHALPIG
jgi:glycosyltransferase involved in cell wall biosynthesis